jgi:uncharacterized membrane protein YfcA
MTQTIKIAFSLLVLAVAIGGYFFLDWLGQSVSPYLSLFLGVFSVFSFWIFPEVANKKPRK